MHRSKSTVQHVLLCMWDMASVLWASVSIVFELTVRMRNKQKVMYDDN